MHNYYVYILECNDKSYYTGITSNLEKRIDDHQSGVVTGYTSKRLPVVLVYYEEYSYVYDAIEREKQIKGWTRKKKELLISGNIQGLLKY